MTGASGRWRAAAAAALCGGAAAAGQAPLGLWPMALAGFAGGIWLVAAAPGARAAGGRAWAFGAGHFLLALSWIVEPFLVEPERHGWMAPFALVLMAGGLGLLWALAGAAGAWAGGGRSGRRAAGVAVALAGVELARGYLFTGFPWAAPGHVWVGTPVMQAAAFVGATGLTALTLLLSALPRLAGPRPGRALGGAAAAGLILAGVWAGGAAREGVERALTDTGIRVRLVQPDAAQHLKWRPDMARLFFERQLELSAAPGELPLDLIVWPETAVPFLLEGETADRALPEMAAAAGGATLVFGVQRTRGWRAWNSLAVLDPSGAVTAVYDKHHLVPFGEYMPFGDILAHAGIRGFAVREGWGYSAGPGPQVLDLGAAGRVLPLICYEAVFPRNIAAAPERPMWILQITNDGWFGEVSGPFQHLAQARLRAVEFGLPVLRAANTGVSAVIDAHGRLRATLPLGTHGAIDAFVPRPLAPTPYARAGDGPLALLLAAAFAGLALGRRRGLDPARGAI